MTFCRNLFLLSTVIALLAVSIVTNKSIFIFITDGIWCTLNWFDSSNIEPLLVHNFLWTSEVYKPTQTEDTYYNLKVTKGKIPSDCAGVLLWIGANSRYKSPGIKQHWFDGDGMIHSIQLIPNNQTAHYSNSWVQTPKFQKETEYKRGLYNAGFGVMSNNGFIGLIKAMFGEFYINHSPFSPISIPNRYAFAPANTAILSWKNKLYALAENSLPFEFRYDYQSSQVLSVGYDTFNDSWHYPFTAHPKIDKINNILYTFGYGIELSNKIIIGKNGFNNERFIKSKIFGGNDKYPNSMSLMHDMMVTENYIIIFDTNILLGPDAFFNSNYQRMVHFHKGKQGRIGILKKSEIESGNLKWFNVSNYCIFHSANAYEENNEIIIISAWMDWFDMDLFQYKNWTNAKKYEKLEVNLQQYRISLKQAKIKEKILFKGVNIEMPCVHPMYLGKKTKFVYFSLTEHVWSDGTMIVHWKGFAKYDMTKNKIVSKIIYDNLDGNKIKQSNFGMSQIVFIPRNNDENDGYLMNMIYHKNKNVTTLRMWDTKEMIADKPVFVLEIPKRVPNTFHGIFVAK
eukprot:388572_1